MGPQSNAILIPWDPENTAHRQALINQREECGWYKDKVESEWRDEQSKGIKSIFWIVSLYNSDMNPHGQPASNCASHPIIESFHSFARTGDRI